MARIPSHGQSLFPGWLRPSSAGSAIIRAEDVDWQNAITDQQGAADILAFLRAQIGDYIRDIGGLTYSNNEIHLSYNDAAGATQTVSADIAAVAQGVVPIVGHTEGWVPTRIPVSDFGVVDTAIWVYRGTGDLVQIGDTGGRINGTVENAPGQGDGAWDNGAGNERITFWSRRGSGEHLNYRSRDGAHSGAHTHETDNGEIHGVAVTDTGVWLLLYDTHFNIVRLVGYTINQTTGAQDPPPNQTIEDTSITADLPSGGTYPDDLGGLVHYDDRIYVLVRGENNDGLPVTQGLAYTTTHPFSRRSADDRFYGVSSDIVGGYFTSDTDWVLQSHWLVKYLATTMLGHNDTPDAFGTAGFPLLVNSSRTGVEFARLAAPALANPLTQIGDSLALSHESLTPLTGIDFTDYEYLLTFVRDTYGRYSNAFIVPYAKLNDLTITTETTILAAGNNHISTTALLGNHHVEYGFVRQSATGLAMGQYHEGIAVFTPNLLATSINTADITDWDSILLGLDPPRVFEWPSAPAGGQFGIVFGDEAYNITWFFASDLFAKDRIQSQTETPTNSNSILLPGIVGRDIRLGRRTAGSVTNAAEVWVSHSGHSPWPLRVYRSWTSNITDLTVHAEVFGLGRR